MVFWLHWRTEEISQRGDGGQVFMREKPLKMGYCQISTKVPLCRQKDFSSFPDLPYSCSPKWPLLALPDCQQRQWSRQVSCRDPYAGRAPLGHCPSPLWTCPIPGSHIHQWLAGMWFPEIPGIYKSAVITQRAAKCQSFIPAHRGLQTSQLDSKRKAKPEYDSTERVCWILTLSAFYLNSRASTWAFTIEQLLQVSNNCMGHVKT